MRVFQSNRTWIVATALVFAPTLLFLGISEPGADDSAADGKALFTTHKCNMCHSVTSAGIEAKMKSDKMKGPDLGGIEREADWIAKYVKKEIQNEGKSHKLEYKGSAEELDAMIRWLAEREPAPAQS